MAGQEVRQSFWRAFERGDSREIRARVLSHAQKTPLGSVAWASEPPSTIPCQLHTLGFTVLTTPTAC
eukprot:7574152-Pyramimonas_sp.AAC.1